MAIGAFPERERAALRGSQCITRYLGLVCSGSNATVVCRLWEYDFQHGCHGVDSLPALNNEQ